MPNFFEVIDWALNGISELEWTITSYLHWAEARFLVIQYETSCYNPEDPDHEEVDSVKRFKLDQTISDTYDGNVHHHTGRFQDFIHVPFPKVSHFQLKWYKVGWANIKKMCETFCASTFLISVDYVSRNETSRSWSAHLSRINDVKHGSIQNKLHIMLVSQTNVVSQIHTHKSERAFILLKPSRHGSL